MNKLLKTVLVIALISSALSVVCPVIDQDWTEVAAWGLVSFWNLTNIIQEFNN